MAKDVFDKWLEFLPAASVMDAGCGDTAFMQPWFEKAGYEYTGIAIGVDNPDILDMDFSFTSFADNSFDLVLARHSLEHSPMPIITLMEWNRISGIYLCVVNPNPDYWGKIGRNHYSVVEKEQIIEWARLAGWEVMDQDNSNSQEIRLLFKKVKNEN
jgi:hypothetical protein